MQVFSIQQQINNNCINYKGKVDNSVGKFINSCAKNECYKYINNLQKDSIVDKNILLKIKNKWEKLLEILILKAKLMHKDTTIKFDYNTEKQGMHIFSQKGYLSFHNSKLDFSTKLQELFSTKHLELYSGGSYQKKKYVKYHEFKDIIENLSPEQVDKKLLMSTISDVKSASRFDENYDKIENDMKNIIEYKNEIGNTENMDFVDIVNNNIKLNKQNYFKNNSQKNISEENLRILNEVFE